MNSVTCAQFHIMQAVRDGVIEASIDHERGFMRSKVHMNIVGPPPCAIYPLLEYVPTCM